MPISRIYGIFHPNGYLELLDLCPFYSWKKHPLCQDLLVLKPEKKGQ